MNNDYFKNRQQIIRILILIVAAIFIIALINLQLIQNYGEIADSYAFYRKTNYAPRGLLYDRNGKLLVFNQPTYDVMITMRELEKAQKNEHPLDTIALCKVLSIDQQTFNQLIRQVKKRSGYSNLIPQRFVTQLSPEDYAVLQEILYNFPGFSIQSRTLRNYSYPNAAHVLGHIGEVSQKIIDNDPFYKAGDYAGMYGIEKAYEKELRGTNGVEILLRDNHGRIQGQYNEGKNDIQPVAGINITATLDINLQVVAENLLQGKRGSIVAIEPATGEILAMASSPTWDPAILVGRKRSKNYKILLNDRTRPLLNRATQGVYSPGSTFKTVQSLVCLQEGAITEHTLYPCNGKNSKPISCTHNHGSMISLENAIEQSCNPYFWNAYRDLLEQDGYGEKNSAFKKRYQLWYDDVRNLGLGPKFSDTDITEQSNGSIPSAKTYDKWYGASGWRALTIRSNAIGQGEVLVTPLQLSNIATIIANGGYYITPHLNKADSMLRHRHQTNIDPKYFSIVQQGMWRVCEYGTGRYYKLDSISMCGKTGTVDNNLGRPHSLFIGFAPKDNPKIAVAVVIENAGFGATWANPIASLVMEQYLTGEIKRKDLYNRIQNSVIDPNVTTRN
jgi:penicillin-binding protein 2